LPSRSEWRWLLEKELRELAASRAFWLLLIVTGALVGHAIMSASALYAEASGAGGGAAALAQGLSPLEGIVVPMLGAYDLAATLLFPFVVIRLVAVEKQTGALALMLQAPTRFGASILAKGVVLSLAWCVALLAGGAALVAWTAIGGHLYAPETWTVVLGYLLRGVLAIGVGAAAGALAASAASAAIIALTVTIGTWALDYVAAARGGTIAAIAQYTPTSALASFEHGDLRVSTVLVLLTIGAAGLGVAAAWLREGRETSRRAIGVAATLAAAALACVGFARIRADRDVSEDRRNSFSRADEAALRRIDAPLTVTVYLAAEDPRLTDLDRGVLAKLRRTMRSVDVEYAAQSRSGLFENSNGHYGEVWYEIGGRREMNRSSTEQIVLETVYRLAGASPPTAVDESAYRGYPLAKSVTAAPWIFFVAWPLLVALAWWRATRSSGRTARLGATPVG
jgi:ABC-2 type transport system permease protein